MLVGALLALPFPPVPTLPHLGLEPARHRCEGYPLEGFMLLARSLEGSQPIQYRRSLPRHGLLVGRGRLVVQHSPCWLAIDQAALRDPGGMLVSLPNCPKDDDTSRSGWLLGVELACTKALQGFLDFFQVSLPWAFPVLQLNSWWACFGYNHPWVPRVRDLV